MCETHHDKECTTYCPPRGCQIGPRGILHRVRMTFRVVIAIFFFFFFYREIRMVRFLLLNFILYSQQFEVMIRYHLSY
jgi:hypothetical protein